MPLGVQRQSVIFFIHKRAELRAPHPHGDRYVQSDLPKWLGSVWAIRMG